MYASSLITESSSSIDYLVILAKVWPVQKEGSVVVRTKLGQTAGVGIGRKYPLADTLHTSHFTTNRSKVVYGVRAVIPPVVLYNQT